MADVLQRVKIARLENIRSQIKELEVTRHELKSLPSKSKVYTCQGNGNVFFLADRQAATSDCTKKLDDAKKELAALEEKLSCATWR